MWLTSSDRLPNWAAQSCQEQEDMKEIVQGSGIDMEGDLYGLLGVPETATKDEIRKAYLSLMLKVHIGRAFEAKSNYTQYHPDKNSTESDQAHLIITAFKILSDPVLRRDYNEKLTGSYI